MRPSLRVRRLTSLFGATAIVALFAAGCGSSGPPATIIVPKGGFANDKADPATMHWFKVHLPAISGLGTLSTLGSLTSPNYSARP